MSEFITKIDYEEIPDLVYSDNRRVVELSNVGRIETAQIVSDAISGVVMK